MKIIEIEEKVLWTPTPNWVQPVDWIEKEQEPSEFSGQFLKYEKQVHVPKKIRYVCRVCRLNNYDDVQHHSILQIEFDPAYQKIHLHNLEVYRGKQKTKIIPRYKQKLVQKENESHLYIFSGIWTLILIIEDLRVGDVLDCSFSYEGFNALYESHILESFLLTNTYPIKHVFCRIIAGNDRVRFKNHNHENEPAIHLLKEGLSEWIWDLYDLKPALVEYAQPSWFEPCSWVQITSFSCWEDVSSAASILFPTQIEPIPEISAKVEQWKTQSSSVMSLILDVIQFVKNEIRYLSLSDDMDAGQAADPNEVFLRRYGDCKDKTGLLCMLFSLIDIPALPALVNTRIRHQVTNWLPSPYAFNHAIVCFSFEECTYWVDPSDSIEVAKISQLPIPQLGYALPLGKANSSLVTLEENLHEQISTTIQFELGKDGLDTAMSVMTSFHGPEAIYFRNFVKNKSEDEIRENYTKYYKNYYREILCKEDVKISDNREENIILLEESYEISNFGTFNKQDNTLTYYFSPLSIYERLPNDIDLDRESPIDLQYPVDIEEKIIIKLNVKVPTDLIDITIENECLTYHLRCYKQGEYNHVIFHSLKTLKNHIPVEDLAKMKSTLQEIYEESARVLQLPRSMRNHISLKASETKSIFKKIYEKSTTQQQLPRSRKQKRKSARLIFLILWALIILLKSLIK